MQPILQPLKASKISPDAQELLVEQTSQQPPFTTYDAVNQQTSYQHQETSYQPAEYQNLSYYNNESQSYDYETPSYQRTPDYHNLTDYSTTFSNSYNSNMATDDYNLDVPHELDQNTVANENDFYKTTSGTLKDAPIDQDAVNEEWQNTILLGKTTTKTIIATTMQKLPKLISQPKNENRTHRKWRGASFA